MLHLKQTTFKSFIRSSCSVFEKFYPLLPRATNFSDFLTPKCVTSESSKNCCGSRNFFMLRNSLCGHSASSSKPYLLTNVEDSLHLREFSTDNFPNKDVEYEQGQSPGPKQREYFYYIDHQGMLFLDDARMKNFTSCFKEKKFLEFFFRRIRVNTSGRYPQFPFVSLCGVEKNYIRCDDLPIVYTHLICDEKESAGDCHLRYNYGSDNMIVAFQPHQIIMEPSTGRVYHPAPPKLEQYCPVALVHTKLALQLASKFRFDDGEDAPPTHLRWQDQDVLLTHHLLKKLDQMAPLRQYSLGL